ncbi:MAG: hypothetical protein CVV13_10170 [Gammaproteobacteria bacterium HGW-Gammaproteobacteria-3]|nr:MAG: hypothetical protein CVV13_10170 [Gammaproteobacteria bacterium HGW-Gammaproteobacteria-3]
MLPLSSSVRRSEVENMAWIVILFGLVIFVVIWSKALDRETARNLKFLVNILAVFIIFISAIVFLSFNSH